MPLAKLHFKQLPFFHTTSFYLGWFRGQKLLQLTLSTRGCWCRGGRGWRSILNAARPMRWRSIPRSCPLRRWHGRRSWAMVVFCVPSQRPRITVRLATTFRLAFVRFLVAVGQHMSVSEMKRREYSLETNQLAARIAKYVWLAVCFWWRWSFVGG